MASFTTDYNPNAVLISVGLTTAMTTGLSLIGCCLKNELYWCFGVLATLIFSLIPMVVFIFYFPKLYVSVIFSFCGTILVSVYIILDTDYKTFYAGYSCKDIPVLGFKMETGWAFTRGQFSA